MKKAKIILTGRAKLLADIHNLHNQMREEVLSAGVQPPQYEYPLRYEDKLTNEELEEFYQFLQLFANGPYTELMKVRNLRPKEFWTNLSLLFQQHSLLEQRMLRKEQAKVRKYWYGKYAPTVKDTTETEPS